MKRYEGLFILNTVGREESVQDMVDRLTADIKEAGGKIETVQKMDKRPFARVANKKFTNGFYVNVIFEAKSEMLTGLQRKHSLGNDVFRSLFTTAPQAPAPAAAA